MDILNVLLNVVLIGLLGGVIFFVTRLHNRLEVVRSGKQELEVLLQDLVTATNSAQQSLTGLRDRAEDLAATLGKQVRGAENAREELSFLLTSADRSAADLVKLIENAKQAVATAPLTSALPKAATAPAAANTEASPAEAKPDPRRQAEHDLMKAIEKLR
jgi:hypothetical protein